MWRQSKVWQMWMHEWMNRIHFNRPPNFIAGGQLLGIACEMDVNSNDTWSPKCILSCMNLWHLCGLSTFAWNVNTKAHKRIWPSVFYGIMVLFSKKEHYSCYTHGPCFSIPSCQEQFRDMTIWLYTFYSFLAISYSHKIKTYNALVQCTSYLLLQAILSLVDIILIGLTSTCP